MSRIANEGLLVAYGATEPQAGCDLAALKTKAVPVMRRWQGGRLQAHRAQAVDLQWRRGRNLHDPGPGAGRPLLVRGRNGAPKASRRTSLRTSMAFALSNTAALFLEDVYVDADRLVGGVEGQGLAQAQAVFGYTRLMVAAFGLGAGWAALKRAIPYSQTAHPGRRPAQPEAGLHAQADRPECRPPGGCARLHRMDGRAHRRRRARPADRGRGRQVSGHRSGQQGGRRFDPGPGRLRLHQGIHGREVQARCAHHHHLRRHLGDHGVDDRPRPLAVASQDARAPTTTTGPPVLTHGAATIPTAARPRRRWPCARWPSSWNAAASTA